MTDHITSQHDHGIEVHRAEWSTGGSDISALRRNVFVIEQGVSEEEEFDNLDDATDTVHIVAMIDSRAGSTDKKTIGCLRLLITENDSTHSQSVKFTRLAVDKAHRHHGIGKRMMQEALAFCLQHGYDNIFLHAQTTALPFYHKLGFQGDGKRFLEANIEHEQMQLKWHLGNLNDDALTTIYGRRVLRLNDPLSFQQHLTQMTLASNRSITISSTVLNSDLYGSASFSDAMSTFLRRSRYAQLNILLTQKPSLDMPTPPLLSLAKRLPSKIDLKICDPYYDGPLEHFLIGDNKRMVFFNNEEVHSGFACYTAAAEAQSRMDLFNNLWNHHANKDKDFSEIHL